MFKINHLKEFSIVIILILFVSSSFCQTKAIIPSTSQEVILFADGTWKYADNFKTESSSSEEAAIFSKPYTSDLLIKGIKVKYGVWLNKNKWTYLKTRDDGTSPSEFTFRLKGEDAYGMLIPEKIEMPIEDLVEMALNNAREVAPDAQIVSEDKRKVNGIDIHFVQMEGKLKGITFVFLAYYYTSEQGIVQFITYTSKNLLKQYRKEMEALLNGFVILK